MSAALPNMTRLLALMSPARVADGCGGYGEVWTELGKHWAEVTPRALQERGVEDSQTSVVNFRITVRAAPVSSPQRPVPGQVFEEVGRRFRILAVTERDAEGRYLACAAREEVGMI